MNRILLWRRALVAPAFGLALLACGGDPTVSTDAAASGSDGPVAESSSDPSAEDLAETNQPNLQPADDARDIEVLSVADGSITTLRDAVDGDRPVLLWFYAPH